MTTREALMSVVETLDDTQLARLLGYAEGLREPRQPGDEATARSPFTADHPADDDADGDPLLALIGAGRSAQPTNVGEHKDDYLAEAFGTLGR